MSSDLYLFICTVINLPLGSFIAKNNCPVLAYCPLVLSKKLLGKEIFLFVLKPISVGITHIKSFQLIPLGFLLASFNNVEILLCCLETSSSN
jgi:hypothetical protein